jgi:hypothetical protein
MSESVLKRLRREEKKEVERKAEAFMKEQIEKNKTKQNRFN